MKESPRFIFRWTPEGIVGVVHTEDFTYVIHFDPEMAVTEQMLRDFWIKRNTEFQSYNSPTNKIS